MNAPVSIRAMTDAILDEAQTDRPQPIADDIPAYPLDCLAGTVIGDAARCIAGGLQVEPAIAGQSLLAAAFLGCQQYAEVLTPAGKKPVSENFLTVSLSGDGKSSVDAVALTSVREQERADFEKHDVAMASWLALPRSERGDKPTNPTRLVTDFTAEGLIRQFREGLPSLGAFSDEAGAVFGGHAFSAEKKLATAAGLSSLWDGAGIRGRARAGDDSGGLQTIPKARLTCHWLIQPSAASEALSDPVLGGQGFWPRVLVAATPPGKPREYRAFDAGSHKEIAAFRLRLSDLLRYDGTVQTSRPTAEAEGMIARFFVAMDKASRIDDGKYSTIRAWGSRATEHLLRVAACLSVFERGFGADITPSEVERAAILVTYSLDCWKHSLDTRPEAEANEYAVRLLAWLQNQPNQQASETAMLRIGPKPRSAGLRDSALSVLSAESRIFAVAGKAWVAR